VFGNSGRPREPAADKPTNGATEISGEKKTVCD